MNVSRLQFHWLLALLLTVMSVPSLAAQKAGQILFARGVVSIVGENDSARGARPGQPVFEGERIVTGRSGIVQVHMTDGAMVGLRANSDYLIKRQRYEPKPAEQAGEEESLYEQAGELFSGWMRMVTGAIGKSNPSNVRQNTSVATIGIRGTIYQVIHVPEEGLPGFPETEPGTYLYLEEGEIELTGEGGTRIVSPGEIVFVPANGRPPRPAPEKRRMFEQYEEVEVYDDDNEYRGDLDIEVVEDPLNDTVTDTLPLEGAAPFNRLGMINIWGFGATGGSDETQLQLAGSGESIYPIKTVADNPEVPVVLEALLDPDSNPEVPQDTGYYQLTGQGSAVASEVFWGRFDELQYSIDSTTAFGDWHYMLASRILYDIRVINNAFPAGQFFFTYVGGTPLTGDLGNILLINSGTAEVQLLTMDVFFDLVLENELGLTTNVTGDGTVAEYLTFGVPVGDGVSLTGSIVGGFAGDGLEGMISAVSLFDDGDSQSYNGTALFEQESGGVTSALVAQSVTTDALLTNPRYRLWGLFPSEDTVTTEGTGENRIVTNLLLGAGLPKQTEIRLLETAGSVKDNGGVQLKDGSYLNWGAWDGGDYEVVYGLSNNQTGTEEWLWLVGDRYLTESIVNTGGSSYLTGTYSYQLAGGTPLYGLGPEADLTVDGGFLQVNFADTSMLVQILVNGGFSILDGSGFISDFYGAGIDVFDTGFGPYQGTLTGAFYGDDAVGAGAWLDINDGSVGQWQAVLGFERGERADETLLFMAANSGGFLEYFRADYVGITTEGTGAGRRPLAYEFNNIEVGYEIAANPDATPVNTGYLAMDDGTEVNWGIWEAGNYSVNGTPTEPGTIDWHYMLANNLIADSGQLQAVAESAGLTGSFTYNLVGQTGMSAATTGSVNVLGSSTIGVDFGTQEMNFNIVTDTLGTFTNGTLIDINGFYQGSAFLLSDVTSVDAFMEGAFVGTEAQGILSTMQINDNRIIDDVKTYYGNLVFQR